MKSRRGALGAFLVMGLVTSLGLLAGLGAGSPAQAATGSPPTTAPDTVSVYQGNFVAVFPVKNDHDPDNDLLTICRLGTEHYKGIDAGNFGDEFDVGTSPNVKPGSYTFTYYTCDYSYLVPGTITVNVVKLPEIKVTPAGRGQIKVKNPFDFKIRFLYGSFAEGSPDAKVLIGPKATAILPVQREKIDWVAYNRKGTLFCGTGHLKGISLRAAGRHPAGPVSLSPKLAQAWRAAG
jgi:hypothetical protein